MGMRCCDDLLVHDEDYMTLFPDDLVGGAEINQEEYSRRILSEQCFFEVSDVG
jgi:hypothetical protein